MSELWAGIPDDLRAKVETRFAYRRGKREERRRARQKRSR
jgi:hypothetical protein